MTVNDRELLELAAQASFFNHQVSQDGRIFIKNQPGIGLKEWNPLTDDGDAFRLAVELDLNIDTLGKTRSQTRLSIVRAAAEIGKTIK